MTKVASIQMCSTSTLDENLETAAMLIEKAAAEGATLAVLPEMFAIIGQNAFDKITIKKIPGVGKIQNFLSNLALNHHIWIVGGTIPLVGDDANKVRSACLVFDSQGNQVARYDKIHLFDAVISEQEVYKESDTTEPGSNIVVLDTPVGKLGLCVCYDIRFPQVFAELSAQGAEVIAIPSAFTVKTGCAHWEILVRCRAIDSFCYVIGACQGGVHPTGRETYGHSMIVSPWGTIIEEVTVPGNAVVSADIQLEKLYEVRSKIPVLGYKKLK